MRNIVLCLAIIMACSVTAADMQAITQHVPDAKKVGQGRYRYLLFNVYDAQLFAPGGAWHADQPYALVLSYLRYLRGDLIAKRSAEEIRKQGFEQEQILTEWQEKMTALFPDVNKNTSITGIRTEQGHTLFYFNDQFIGRIDDTQFSDLFFGIWLSEATTAPGLRRQLLGGTVQTDDTS
ncbi:MAG: chalcone isomerase family protein [Pseudomonadota bacterium]